MKTTMRILVAAACMGLCGSWSVQAKSPLKLEITQQSGLTYAQALQILEAAFPYFNDNYGITFAELQQRYDDGVCTITPVQGGYKVNGGGGLGSVTVLDDF